MSVQTKRFILTGILALGFLIAGAITSASKQLPSVENTRQQKTHSQNVLSASEKGERSTGLVTKVVDGDTIEVTINNVQQKIRIIGINTPESVDPRRGVQCFGIDASNAAKEKLAGQSVQLEKDPTQSERDKYGRLLRFVWMENGKKDFGAWMIANGYAYEYTYDTPHTYQASYRQLQQEAENNQRGLWSPDTCKGETSQSLNKPSVANTKKKCSDFTTRQEAQGYFDAHGGTNSSEVKRMDGNSDGEACETLP